MAAGNRWPPDGPASLARSFGSKPTTARVFISKTLNGLLMELPTSSTCGLRAGPFASAAGKRANDDLLPGLRGGVVTYRPSGKAISLTRKTPTERPARVSLRSDSPSPRGAPTW
jgi:hypothetical protein